jgi:transcriptional regulator with XRE-family HTH domain
MFGAWIKAQREARGWSQTELARRIGVKQNAVSQWEAGDRQPTQGALLVKLAHVFGTTVEEMMAGLSSGGPSPRAAQLAELEARAVAAGMPAHIEAVLQQVRAHQQSPEDVWVPLSSVLHALLVQIETTQHEGGREGMSAPAGRKDRAPARPPRTALAALIGEEGGDYHPTGEAFG